MVVLKKPGEGEPKSSDIRKPTFWYVRFPLTGFLGQTVAMLKPLELVACLLNKHIVVKMMRGNASVVG